MIEKVFIQNFKIFESFELSLNKDLNILVGDNETGKSTILEAISLGLTKRLGGRPIEFELSSHLFNKKCVDSYVKSLSEGKNPELPRILIELYLTEKPELQFLRGSNNSQKSDFIGLRLEIAFDDDYRDEYAKLLEDKSQIKSIPAEYYEVHWYSFANKGITSRSLPVRLSLIDATTIRLQSGTDYYLQNIIGDSLDVKERVELTIAYRKLKERFSDEPSIKGINTKLTGKKGTVTGKDLTIAIDISQKSNWETSLVPHLDDLPFHLIGKGEQSALKVLLALERHADDTHIILIEEPENHQSFSSMSVLISKVREKCEGKQIIIATHSAYVLNKLGIEKVIWLSKVKPFSLKRLSPDTQDYFRKLSGYDTLRLILAKKAILVEGPSDELIVQKAYLLKHGRLPVENGVDVINVRGLSFKRFLDIARELEKEVAVVTDNDGNYQSNIVERYETYKEVKTIKIFADKDNGAATLEPQIAKCNDLAKLNEILGTSCDDSGSLVEYMVKNKTECALKIFDTGEAVGLPQYIQDAVQ
jgi:putative ATP-dependent endonuclease of the OLD family